MNHEQTQLHNIHHGPDLGEATTFPFIVYYVFAHWTGIQMALCLKTPKWEFANFQNWDSHNFVGHNFVCRPSIGMRFTTKL
jgi:hypothetical protein